MDPLPALRNRLAKLRGELLWGRLPGTAPDAGWLACELIEAGLDTTAVWGLAGHTLSVGPMSDVEPLVRQVLVESGYPPIDLQRISWAVAKDVAQGIVDGTLPIGTGGDFLLLELGDRWLTPQEIRELIFLIDDWEDLHGTPPTDDELRELTGKIVDFARAVLEAKEDPGP